MSRDIDRRLMALEACLPAVVPLQPPYWSEEHGMMMQNHGGFIVPAPMTVEEWEARTVKQQAALIGALIPWDNSGTLANKKPQ